MARLRESCAIWLPPVGGANAASESYRAAEEQLKLLNPRGVPKAGNTSPRAPQDPQTPALDLPQVGEQQTQESPVQAEVQDTTLATRQLHGWFWPLMAALVVAEFIGNAPVFTELFPRDAQLALQLSEWLSPIGLG